MIFPSDLSSSILELLAEITTMARIIPQHFSLAAYSGDDGTARLLDAPQDYKVEFTHLRINRSLLRSY